MSEDRAKADKKPKGSPEGPSKGMDLLKVVAMPVVTLFVGLWFNAALNTRQTQDNNLRLYTDMMGRREQADSDLRKDMFSTVLKTFTVEDPKMDPDQRLNQEVLDLELLAYNFHESLDIGPLFKNVRRKIPDQPKGPYTDLRERIEKVAGEVIGRQLTVVSDGGMVVNGATSLLKVKDLKAYLFFDTQIVPGQSFQPGEGVSTLCLSKDVTTAAHASKHYRQFKLEIINFDPQSREVRVRLYASRVLNQADCLRPDLDTAAMQEIDINFWVGLFDFPMIDNTRLSEDERCAVSIVQLTPDFLKVSLAYFSGSRASLKDKPYYDEVAQKLIGQNGTPAREKN